MKLKIEVFLVSPWLQVCPPSFVLGQRVEFNPRYAVMYVFPVLFRSNIWPNSLKFALSFLDKWLSYYDPRLNVDVYAPNWLMLFVHFVIIFHLLRIAIGKTNKFNNR